MGKPMLRHHALVILCAAALVTSTYAAEPTVSATDLPRVKPTDPGEALKTFQVRKGFHLEMVAAEPLVIDPIAMCFDENGRMFVIEMRDYSERREERLSRIRMLEDADGDGTYEKATVFLDDLPWATALFWYDGGLLVGATPDILYAKDTTGDGVADEKKVLFTGFGTTPEKLNVQGLFNNFQWGLDNRIHGCSGLVGGLVTRANGSPAAPPRDGNREPLDVRGKGLVIDPRTWSMTTEAGGGQYGLSFDPTGRLFTCSNSSHIETFMYDLRYAARNPHVDLPHPRVAIPVDGPAAEVYRISPEEPWRVIRTRWRVAGVVKGPIEGGGRSAGYFTGATGITIYRGDAYPSEYLGDAFTGDAGGNLVHHKRIRRDAKDPLKLLAERPPDEKKIEFVASTDNWFRPVDFANAPDGTLYIADMYRETIEHPWSIPPQIKQHLDLNSGNDRGRIYRIAPDGFQYRKPPRLGDAGIAELVKTLEDRNGWHRETASRLLFQRQDPAATPLLRTLLKDSSMLLARLHALHALDGMGALSEADVVIALEDVDATVRVHAVRLSETFLADGRPSEALWSRLAARAHDDDVDVRHQLAFTLGEIRHPERIEVLAQAIRPNLSSPWMQTAALSSLADGAAEMIEQLASSPEPAFVQQVAQAVAAKQDASEIDRVTEAMNRSTDASIKMSIARGLAEGADRTGALPSMRPKLADAFQSAAQTLTAEKSAPKARLAAIGLLGFAEYPVASPALLAVLDARRSQSLHPAVLGALDRYTEAAIADEVVGRWSNLSPRARSAALELLIKRPARALALLAAVKSGTIPAGDLDPAQTDFLRKHADNAVKALAMQVLPEPTAARDQVVQAFRSALALPGDASRGRTIYQQRCISCHRANGEGFSLGPDLTTVRNAGREKLLVNILDPSREVQPNYVSFLVETTDGQSVLGVITSDTQTGVTIRQAYGRETTVPRARIKRMTSQGKSVMPDALEVGLKPQDLADLLTFVETATP
jgi:putative membrane-bound dehydrogenase-like protein